MARSKKKIVVATGALVAVVVALLVANSWDRLLEEWYLHGLNSDDPATQLEAAEGLVALDSTRAISALAKALASTASEDGFVEFPIGFFGIRILPSTPENPRTLDGEAVPTRILLTPLAYFLHELGVGKCEGDSLAARRESAAELLGGQDVDVEVCAALKAVRESWCFPNVTVERSLSREIGAARERDSKMQVID